MMFASVNPEHFEGTIEYDCRYHGEECYGCVFESERQIDFEPHNRMNPILVWFRDLDRDTQDEVAAHLTDANSLVYPLGIDCTRDHAMHARKVLRRYVGLAA